MSEVCTGPGSQRRGRSCATRDLVAILLRTGDSDPLLHDLQPDHELNAAARVQFPRSDPEEHAKVILLLGRLALEFANVADVLELRLALFGVGAALATQAAEDVAGFVFAADVDEPAGGFGHEEDDAEQEEERGDLEGDGEAPDEVGCSVWVGRESALPFSSGTSSMRPDLSSDTTYITNRQSTYRHRRKYHLCLSVQGIAKSIMKIRTIQSSRQRPLRRCLV